MTDPKIMFYEEDLPTLRRLRDGMARLYDATDPDTGGGELIHRINLAFTRDFAAKLIADLEAEAAKCKASTLTGGRCELRRHHSGRHVNRGYQWTDEDMARLADRHGSRFD